MNNNPKCYFN